MVEQQQEKDTSLPWTGERYVPELGGPIRLEHIHRYLLARDLVAGKLVLDIASGEGYGTAMIAEVANWAVGVDISPEAVNHAQKTYKKNNLEFRIGSCVEIPYPDQSFDVIVSFETIEHHSQHDEMMAEFKRVLRPNGQIIISSPDKYEYSVAPNFNNTFHTKELYRHEFEKLLKAYFSHVVIFGQRVLYGSAIISEGLEGKIKTYDSQDRFFNSSKGLKRPLYLIAIASEKDFTAGIGSFFEQELNESEPIILLRDTLRDRDSQISILSQTTMEQENRVNDLTQAVQARDGQIAGLHQELADFNQSLADRDDQIAVLSKAVQDRDGRIARIAQALVDHDREISNLTQAVVERDGQITNLTQAITN